MIKIKKLSQGINLILDYVNSVGSVSVGIWCKTGSMNEFNENLFGVSHFIEHMLFKGTETLSAYEISAKIDSIGGQINAFTGKEYTCFYVKSLKEHFIECADILTDMIENPAFEEDEITREKGVVIEEINMNQDDPDDVAIENLLMNLFKDSELEHPILGSLNSVSSFNRKDIKDYYYDRYSKENIIVSVAGNFDEEQIISYFEKHFSHLNDKSEKQEIIVPIHNPIKKTIKKDIEQSHIAIGMRIDDLTIKERLALQIANTILGTGMSSRLFQNIREKRGLAYSIYSSIGYYNNSSILGIMGGISKNKDELAIEEIFKEVENLKQNSITDYEFKSAKEQIKSGFIFSQESIDGRMVKNGKNLIKIGKCMEADDYINIINDISLKDVNKEINKIANTEKYSMINVTSKQEDK